MYYSTSHQQPKLRLCLGVWRGGKGKALEGWNIGENGKIFHIFFKE
jgi:hypothetical protein